MDRLEKAKHYIFNLLETQLDPVYTYHNYEHSLMVLNSVNDISSNLNLSDDDVLILQLAALFHDSGIVNGINNHEERSQKIAKEYLLKEGFTESLILKVNQCIAATRMGTKTDDLLGQIIQDADMSGLGNVNYPKITEKLRYELNNTSSSNISKSDWLSGNLDFLQNCIYNTTAAKELYEEQKKKNYNKLLKKQIKENKKSILTIANNKSAQTQFKTALRNHIDLSNIADNKANIMISVNALILTVALPFLIDKSMNNYSFWVPTVMLAIVCLSSMIFATLATRPIKLKGVTSKEEVINNTSNLFFFGNYHKMKYEDYKEGISHVINNSNALDDSIIRDLFFLGKSLGGKFSSLRLCYNIFMYGITVTVGALLLVFLN